MIWNHVSKVCILVPFTRNFYNNYIGNSNHSLAVIGFYLQAEYNEKTKTRLLPRFNNLMLLSTVWKLELDVDVWLRNFYWAKINT